MKKLILLSLLFAPFSSLAENRRVDCSAFLYEKVIISPVSADQLAAKGVAGGSAGFTVDGTRSILYDQELESIPEVKNHVIAHECAHHALGHVESPTIHNYYANKRIKEHPADCLASRMLITQLRYGEKEFDVISDFLSEVPEGVARGARVKRCAR